MSKLRRNKGLTLLQLLIVLSIASILILAGVPEFRDMIENHKLRAITEKFYSDLQLVRSETIKNQEDIYVNLNSDSNWCYGINNATPCDCKTANNCQDVKSPSIFLDLYPISDSISLNIFTIEGGFFISFGVENAKP